jgi:hypothetical protein
MRKGRTSNFKSRNNCEHLLSCCMLPTPKLHYFIVLIKPLTSGEGVGSLHFSNENAEAEGGSVTSPGFYSKAEASCGLNWVCQV